jgi:hypothetical protein
LEQPAEIQEVAQALSKAIWDQIDQLSASKPNEPESLARQNDFVAFLQEIANGLDALAASIGQAFAASSTKSPDPILLGKTAEIANKLSAVVREGLKRNRVYILECSIKVSLFAAGVAFLDKCGVNPNVAAAVLVGIMKLKLPKLW